MVMVMVAPVFSAILNAMLWFLKAATIVCFVLLLAALLLSCFRTRKSSGRSGGEEDGDDGEGARDHEDGGGDGDAARDAYWAAFSKVEPFLTASRIGLEYPDIPEERLFALIAQYDEARRFYLVMHPGETLPDYEVELYELVSRGSCITAGT